MTTLRRKAGWGGGTRDLGAGLIGTQTPVE